MKNLKWALLFVLVALLIFNLPRASAAQSDIPIRDEGTLAGRAREINCVGAGLDCSVSGGIAAFTLSAPGSDTQILFNSGGSLGASADFAWTPGGGYGTISLDGTTGSEIFFHAGGVGYWEVGTDGEIGGTNRDFFINNSQLAFPAIVISGDDNKIQVSDFVFSGNPFPESVNLLAAYNVTSATSGLQNSVGFYSRYTATDGTTSDGRKNLISRIEYGFGGTGAIGLAEAFHSDVFVQGSGSTDNEYAAMTTNVVVNIGTGYTQSTGPVGRIWHWDGTVLGPVGVQPDALNGSVLILNNYYNGSPADSPSAGFWLTTKGDSGNGIDATHAAATSYPNDVGLGIVGQSSSSGVGWTTAIQLGGTGSPWGEAASKIGTGIDIRDYTTRGIYVHNPSGTPTADIEITGKAILPDARITKIGQLTSNGFLKTGSGDGTLSVDTSTYITSSAPGTLTNLTLDAEGTGNTITIPFTLWLPMAGCAGTTCGSIWDLPSSNPMVPSGTVGTNTVQGYGAFADGSNLSAQYTWRLPGDWTGAIDAVFKWFTPATSGSVVWQLATSCVADAETNDPSFNTASTVTDAAKGTTLQTNDATISSVTVTGCAAGELMHLKVFRDSGHASDNLAATANLIGIEIKYRRAL